MKFGLMLLLLTAPLQAAMVERVLVKSNLVVVKLSKVEKSQLSSGQSVTFKVGTEEIVGKVKSIKSGKALLTIDFGVESVKTGSKVQFSDVSYKRKKKKEKVATDDTFADEIEAVESPGEMVTNRSANDTQREYLATANGQYGVFFSPAQTYQTSRSQINAGLDYFKIDGEVSGGDEKTTYEGSDSDYFVQGVFASDKFPFRLGLVLYNYERSVKVKFKNDIISESGKGKQETDSKTITLAYENSKGLVFGAALNLMESTRKFDDEEKKSVSYDRIDLGVIKKDGRSEYGLLYVPQVKKDDPNDLDIATPAYWALHCDIAQDSTTRYSGYLAHIRGHMLDGNTINSVMLSTGIYFDDAQHGYQGMHFKFSSRSYLHPSDKSILNINNYAFAYDQKLPLDLQAALIFGAEVTYGKDEIEVEGGSNKKISALSLGIKGAYSYKF